ncbi:hypothetical protein LXA43DRAFT_1088452 [Ganoderma leucocontextum]|nr:hypothetical protein LXA43DRAFT_1088452 [Ganoderma leucocontextum]
MSSLSTKSPKFDLIVDLPESLLPTFTSVATFIDTHVTSDKNQVVGTRVASPGGKPADVHFKWSGFRNSITSRPGTDITFDRVQSTTIHSQDNSAADPAAKVTGFIADSFPALAREQLTKRTNLAFADPSEHESRHPHSDEVPRRGEGFGQDWVEYRVSVPKRDPHTHLTLDARMSQDAARPLYGPMGDAVLH